MAEQAPIELLRLRDGATLEDLEAALGRLPANRVRRAGAFAFHVYQNFIDTQTTDKKEAIWAAAKRRVGEKPIFLVSLITEVGVIRVYRFERTGLSEEDPTQLLAIRQADLTDVLLRAGPSVFFRGSSGHHFVTPNLKHTKAFLRVGDVIFSREALETLALWSCPPIAGADAVLLDTWSIAAVPLRAMQLLGRFVTLDSIVGHPGTEREPVKRVLARTLRSLPVDGKVVFLCSVTADADLLQESRKIVRGLGRTDIVIDWVTLYAFSNAPTDDEVEVFCRLDEDWQSWEAAECPACEAGSHAVPLDSRAFRVTDANESALSLNPEKGHFETSKEFLEQYGNEPGVLRVHRDDPNDGVHHAFYVDVISLLETDQFLRGVLQAISEVRPQPDLVATPEHNAGRALARLAAEHLGVPLVIHNDLRRSRADTETIETLDEVKCVLIIDDVLKTGSRLLDFTRSLREDYRPFGCVHYLVGVARCESERDLSEIERALTTKHQWQCSFRYVEKILVPGWGTGECPWCQEYDALTRMAERLSRLPSWLMVRLQHLSALDTGILKTPFLTVSGHEERPLGGQSPVGPAGLSAQGTLFAFSSALQSMRTAPDVTTRLQPEFPVFRSLAPRNFTNYSEGLTRKCLLRLVQAGEWHSDAREKPLELFLARLNREPQILGEFFLAMSRRTLRPCFDSQLTELWRTTFGLKNQDFNRLVG